MATVSAVRTYPPSPAGIEKLEADVRRQRDAMMAALASAPDWDTTLRLQGALSVLNDLLGD